MFTKGTGTGRLYEVSGWQPAEDGSTWAQGPASTLVLQPEAEAGPLALDLTMAGLVGPSRPEEDITVSTSGTAARAVWRWRFGEGNAWTLHTLCLPPAVERQDGVVTIEFRTPAPRSPREAGLGSDDRTLSFALRAMALRQARSGECDS